MTGQRSGPTAQQTEIHTEAIVVDWSVKEDNVLDANFDQKPEPMDIFKASPQLSAGSKHE